jgi:Ca2+-binding RTX toxin-like protein
LWTPGLLPILQDMNSTRLRSLLAFGALALTFTIGGQAARGGTDDPTCFGQPATMVAPQSSTDPVVGTAGDDVIVVLDSNRIVEALAGDDRVCAVGEGVQEIYGGEGSDLVSAGDWDDAVYGQGGDDRLVSGEGIDVLNPGSGRDRIRAQQPGDAVSYADAAKPVRVDLAAGVARGDGRDVLMGVQEVFGSPHADVIVGNRKHNFIEGEAGDDAIAGGREVDAIYGGPGNDEVMGGRDKDYLHGEDGRDRVLLGAASSPHGGAAFGGPGSDVLVGSPARDRLYGGNGGGADKAFGRGGRDRCRGVERRDSCLFVPPFG